MQRDPGRLAVGPLQPGPQRQFIARVQSQRLGRREYPAARAEPSERPGSGGVMTSGELVAAGPTSLPRPWRVSNLSSKVMAGVGVLAELR